MFTRTWLLWAGLMAIGCKRPPPAISFYYWKTSYGPSMADSAVLAENQVKELYLRYFDLDIPPSENSRRCWQPSASFSHPTAACISYP